MKSISTGVQNIALIGLVSLLVLGSFFASAPAANAQYDDFSSGGGYYDDFSSGGGYYDDYSSGGGSYDDYSSGGGYYDDYSAGGGYFDDYSSGGGYFDDYSSGGGYYDDFSSGGGYYDDFSSGGGFYDDFSTGGGFYDDFSSGGGYYDDFSAGGGYYDDFSVGGSYYDDMPRSGSYYDDALRSGTWYDDVPRSGSYYDDVAQTAGSQTVYNPTTGLYESTSYTPASYAVDSYTPASYAIDSYTPNSYAMTTGGYGSSLGYGGMPYAASVGASMPFYQQQYQQQRSQNYPTPSYPNYSQPSYSNVNTSSNYCTGNSCNSSYIDNSYVNNSINSSFNTTHPSTISTVYPVTALPIVQYQYPYSYNYNYSYPTYNTNLYCTITASPTFIQNGQASYLSWSSNGSSAWLSDGIGYVSANGSLAVRPDATRTYTLTIYGQGGSNVCSVTVSVGGSAPYVSLSQIPYTGFDLGPIGNAMYMLSLVAVAIGAAYFALYYKGGVLAIAGSMIKRPIARITPVVAHASYAAPAPIVHSTPASREIKDTMFITRSKDGVPRIVINRA